MIVFVCNISWQRNFKSNQNNWILKKVPKDYENTFYNISIKGSTKKNLILSWRNELQDQFDKLPNWKIWENLIDGLFTFKLFSFLNGLSHRRQIGLKLKIIGFSFKVFWKVSTDLMFWIQFITFTFDKFLKMIPFLLCFFMIHVSKTVSFFLISKTTSNYLSFETNRASVGHSV